MQKNETPADTGASPNLTTGQISSDFRAPLWRGRWPATPEKLRAQFERYVDEFEAYMEQRRAA
jgi:hypothetical protein